MSEAAGDLLGRLAERTCPAQDCEGTLERDSYKGTAAVLCRECGMPAVRTWEP